MAYHHSHIILFDGVCNLCNGSVQFLIRRDKNSTFRFASMQSETGRQLLNEYGLTDEDFDTFAYIQHGTPFIKSTAALHVARELGGGWKLLYGLIIIPEKLRDYVYSLVASNRYKWFGKRDSCMIPTPELKDRFL